jgi:hypothetical protein
LVSLRGLLSNGADTVNRFKVHKLDLQEFGIGNSPEYFLHGGGEFYISSLIRSLLIPARIAFPVKLVNYPFPVAVIVVSGMPSQADDHEVSLGVKSSCSYPLTKTHSLSYVY